jgi:WD40 repeat protein
MEFAATRLEEPLLGRYPYATFSPCGTCFAVCAYPTSRVRQRELALFDLRTMAKTQSVVLSGGRFDFGCLAMSPDGKKLGTTNIDGDIRLFECHDLTIQKCVDTIVHGPEEVGLRPVAFDPTSRYFAVGCIDGRVKLRTL